MRDLYEELGYSFVYHYNSYEKKHYCICREDYRFYFNGFKDKCKIGWTSGDTVEDVRQRVVDMAFAMPGMKTLDDILGDEELGPKVRAVLKRLK